MTGRWSLATANLVIASVWAVWHLPLFWVVGGSHQEASFTLFLVAGIGYSAVMTWLYARTHSIALCVLFHAGINAAATAGLAFPVDETPGFAVQAAVAVTFGTVLLIVSQHRGGGGGHPSFAGARHPRTGAGRQDPDRGASAGDDR